MVCSRILPSMAEFDPVAEIEDTPSHARRLNALQGRYAELARGQPARLDFVMLMEEDRRGIMVAWRPEVGRHVPASGISAWSARQIDGGAFLSMPNMQARQRKKYCNSLELAPPIFAPRLMSSFEQSM